jgi:signal recognition particle receptor subunit beta
LASLHIPAPLISVPRPIHSIVETLCSREHPMTATESVDNSSGTRAVSAKNRHRRRVGESFSAVDYFEELGQPFLIAVNEFDDAPRFPEEAIRDALSVPDDVPVMMIDARNRESAKNTLIAVTSCR